MAIAQSNHGALHELVSRYKANSSNECIQAEVLTAIKPLVQRLIGGINHPDVELLQSDIQYQILLAAVAFDPARAKFTSFCYTIIKRSIHKFLSTADADTTSLTGSEVAPCVRTTLDDIILREDIAHDYQRIHESLQPHEQLVLSLFMHGHTHKQVAKRIGISTKTLSNRLINIRKRARALCA